MSRLEEIKKRFHSSMISLGRKSGRTQLSEDLRYLFQQAERVEELEYASKYNGELNEFLQKRKLPPNTLGRHVVDVVMDYVEELEQEREQDPRQGMLEDAHMENERYKQALEEIANAGENIDDLYYYQEKARELINQSK